MENTPSTIKSILVHSQEFTHGLYISDQHARKVQKIFVYHVGRHWDTEGATMNTTEIMSFCKTLVFLWVHSPVLNLWWLCSELFTPKTIFCLVLKIMSRSHPEKFNYSWFDGSFSWYHCEPYHFFILSSNFSLGDVPVVQWQRLCTPSEGSWVQSQIGELTSYATTKTGFSQINEYKMIFLIFHKHNK